MFFFFWGEKELNTQPFPKWSLIHNFLNFQFQMLFILINQLDFHQPLLAPMQMQWFLKSLDDLL